VCWYSAGGQNGNKYFGHPVQLHIGGPRGWVWVERKKKTGAHVVYVQVTINFFCFFLPGRNREKILRFRTSVRYDPSRPPKPHLRWVV